MLIQMSLCLTEMAWPPLVAMAFYSSEQGTCPLLKQGTYPSEARHTPTPGYISLFFNLVMIILQLIIVFLLVVECPCLHPETSYKTLKDTPAAHDC